MALLEIEDWEWIKGLGFCMEREAVEGNDPARASPARPGPAHDP